MKGVVFALGLIVALTGCSVTLMKRVPSDHNPRDYPTCTSAVSLPAADGILTVLSGASAVNLHSAASNPENDGKSFRTFAWSTTGLALAFLASATYGALQRNRCRRAKLRSGYGGKETPRTNKPLPGTLGGACRRDASCDGDLVCDTPMNSCIQLNPTDETLPPPDP